MKDFDELTTEEKWGIIHDAIREVDTRPELSRIYVNIYQDNNDNNILVFDDNDSSDEFNKVLIELLKANEIDISFEEHVSSARNDKDVYFVNRLTDDTWTFRDEGFVCDECYRWHYYENRNGVGYVNYFCGDGWIVCLDCLKENDEYIKMYLADKIDNPKDANILLEENKLEDLGFEKINDYPYENGMYGDNDQPIKILEKTKEQYPNMECLFNIRKIYNPYTTQFDLYGREVSQ